MNLSHTINVSWITELKRITQYYVINLFSSRHPINKLRFKTKTEKIARLVERKLLSEKRLALFLFYTFRQDIFKRRFV